MNEISDERLDSLIRIYQGMDPILATTMDIDTAVALAELRCRREAAQVSVKALKWSDVVSVPDGAWSEISLSQSRGHHNLGRYAGSYSVQEVEPGGWWGWWNSWSSDNYPEGVEKTREGAKAASQADFESRILSVIRTVSDSNNHEQGE